MKRNVARGTVLGVAGQGWHLVTALAVFALLARSLGPALFGRWQVVISVLGWVEVFVTAGLVRVATKAISEAPEDAPFVARAGYIGQIVLGVVLFLVVQLLAQPVARLLGDATLATPLRIAALDIPLYAAFMAASAVVLGTQRFERQAVAWVAYATSKAVLVAGAVLLGYGVAGALVGNALSSFVGLAAMFVPLAAVPVTTGWVDVQRRLGQMVRPALPFLTIGLVEGFDLSASLWLVSAVVANGVLIGLYASAAALAEIPVFLFLGLNRVIFPSIAEAIAKRDTQRAADYARQAVRLALIVTVLGIAFAAGSGRQILQLIYSAPYVAAFVPLVLLIAAGAGRAIRTVCTEALLAENRRRPALAVLLATVTLQVVLVAVLAMRFGLAGAAAGAASSALIAAVWAAVLIRDLIGTRPLATLLRCAGAGVVVGIGLALMSPAPILIPLALPIAGIVYGLVLALLGEFSADDIASFRTVVGSQGRA